MRVVSDKELSVQATHDDDSEGPVPPVRRVFDESVLFADRETPGARQEWRMHVANDYDEVQIIWE